jgi:hypothetical protein
MGMKGKNKKGRRADRCIKGWRMNFPREREEGCRCAGEESGVCKRGVGRSNGAGEKGDGNR